MAAVSEVAWVTRHGCNGREEVRRIKKTSVSPFLLASRFLHSLVPLSPCIPLSLFFQHLSIENSLTIPLFPVRGMCWHSNALIQRQRQQQAKKRVKGNKEAFVCNCVCRPMVGWILSNWRRTFRYRVIAWSFSCGPPCFLRLFFLFLTVPVSVVHGHVLIVFAHVQRYRSVCLMLFVVLRGGCVHHHLLLPLLQSVRVFFLFVLPAFLPVCIWLSIPVLLLYLRPTNGWQEKLCHP